MAECPHNVDDPRLLLPPELFLNDVVPPQLSLQNHLRFAAVDDLAHQLAALTLLKQRRTLSLQRFSPAVVPTGQLDSRRRSLLGGFYDGSGVHLGGTELCHLYPYPNPAQLQLLDSRARALRRHQNQAQIPNQNRLVQFHGPMGGFERVSGGTGVFHPRVLDSNTTTKTTSQVKKKPGLRSKQENRGNQQRKSTNKCVGVGEDHQQLCPDIMLPQEWTY